jgi:C-terminal processing protease CtpA/Prc
MDSLKNRLNAIFEQIQKDNLKYLFIDVSKNGGGNSSVGDMLIDYFYDKSYGTYRCDWKKSEEYLKLLKSWGGEPGAQYSNTADGEVLHFASDTVGVASNPYRFKGKAFVVVGNGTFSSAIMFATIVKDNHIAELAGEVPANGHPNHFGEMYNTKLPNTKIDLRFGVKEWIRPSGEKTDNKLHPDILVDLSLDKTELVKAVIEKAK